MTDPDEGNGDNRRGAIAGLVIAVVLLAVGIAALQAWWTGRRGSVRELRAGEGR